MKPSEISPVPARRSSRTTRTQSFVVGERLFAHHRFPGAYGGDGEVRVGRVVRGDDDGVDIRVGDERMRVAGRPCCPRR
jgi:hypothetical protein